MLERGTRGSTGAASVDLDHSLCRVTDVPDKEDRQPSRENRLAIHATCALHRGPRGFANLVVRNLDHQPISLRSSVAARTLSAGRLYP